MKQTILAVIAVMAIILAGNFVVNKFYLPPVQTSVQNQQDNFQQVNESVGADDEFVDSNESSPQVPFMPGGEISGPSENQPIEKEIKEVIYKDSGYSPSTLTIKAGNTIVFKNESSNGMWTASAMHPSHMAYSGASLEEHCPDLENIVFDECGSAQPGDSWSFTFTKKGAWGYHNHLKPSHFGKIIVE